MDPDGLRVAAAVAEVVRTGLGAVGGLVGIAVVVVVIAGGGRLAVADGADEAPSGALTLPLTLSKTISLPLSLASKLPLSLLPATVSVSGS